MRKRIAILALTSILTVGTFLSTMNMEVTYANGNLEQRIDTIQQERSQKEKEIKKRENEISKLKRERTEMEEEIQTLDFEMEATQNDIQEKEKEVEEAHEEIERLQEELEIIEVRIAERDEILKDRARTMYKNGGSIDYLEVLFGAKSFGDFIERLGALTMIAQQDHGILETHLEDQKLAEETKVLVESELEKLEDHLIVLGDLMSQLDIQKEEKNSVVKELLSQEGDLQTELGDLVNEEEVLSLQEKAMQQELVAYKERQKKDKEKQLSSRQSKPSEKSNNTVSGSGTLLRPASGTITSPFGNRVHPIRGTNSFHRGLDIANATGTPIYSAEGGTVITASYEPGYGNYIMISHNINGQVMTTVYAHLSSIQVSNGQRVSRGQEIGKMGSTGSSTGPHLHFEVHLGPFNGDANAVNPINYIQ